MTQKCKDKLLLLANKKKRSIEEIHCNGEQLFKKKKNSGGIPTFLYNSTPLGYELPQFAGKDNNYNNTQQHMDVDQDVVTYFEEEIVMEILSSLPVRSLIRFKCVSKFLKALISDPYFKRKHLNHASNDQNSQKLLIGKKRLGKDDFFKFYCSSLSSVQVVEDEHKLDCPSNCKPVGSKLCCCCDGLVLLKISDGPDNCNLLLWNPSTRESIEIPYQESSNYCYWVYGMGYDATSDDYKILAVNLNKINDNLCVKILALKSGSWRKIDKYPTGVRRVFGFMDCGMHSLAFMHGAFHWLGLSQYYTIVSFDISNEAYGEIPLPERVSKISHANSKDRGISVLRGMLCFYSTYHISLEGTFKLWVMKDYGVEESWTQLLTIQGANIFHSAEPKYMFVDGEVLLSCNHISRVGYEYRTSKGPFDVWIACATIKQGFVYTESLISPRLLI